MLMFLLLLSLITQNTIGENPCVNLDFSISQKIENEGFHRELEWFIEIEKPSPNCNFTLQLDIPNGMFVNPDQLADLNRANKLSSLINGFVDIELPTHLSPSHSVFIYIPKFIDKIHLMIPIHLRYHRSQIAGRFAKIILKKPSILGQCESIFCKNFSTIEAPCDSSPLNKTCNWKNITYTALFEEAELFVPIGNLNDYPIVSITTLLLGCAGCIYILSILSTTHL